MTKRWQLAGAAAVVILLSAGCGSATSNAVASPPNTAGAVSALCFGSAHLTITLKGISDGTMTSDDIIKGLQDASDEMDVAAQRYADASDAKSAAAVTAASTDIKKLRVDASNGTLTGSDPNVAALSTDVGKLPYVTCPK